MKSLCSKFWNGQDSELLFNPLLDRSKDLMAFWEKERRLVSPGVFALKTSGTTSELLNTPLFKLIILNKQRLLSSAEKFVNFFGLVESDTWLRTLPLFHIAGLSIEARAFVLGAQVHVLPSWDPRSFLDLVATRSVNFTSLVPTQIFDLVRYRSEAPASLKSVFVGAGKVSENLFKEARCLGWPRFLTYGMTETAAMVASSKLNEMALFPLPYVDMRVSKESRIQVRSDYLFQGSLEGDLVSARFHTPEFDDQGFWTSSDLGRFHPGGALEILGRAHDEVKVKGELVSVHSLRALWENLVSDLDWSKDLYLMSFPDSRDDHVIALAWSTHQGSHFFEQQQSLLWKKIRKFNSQVLPFERIRAVRKCNYIPRTELGKVKELELREHLKEFESYGKIYSN